MINRIRPISALAVKAARRLRFVLMDIDDTLTDQGKLGSAAYEALWHLRNAGLVVVPVTGRPAAWCDLIARQWPVDGVIGENGALAFWEEPATTTDQPGLIAAGKATVNYRPPSLRQTFHPAAVRNDHPRLIEIRDQALTELAGLRVAKDQFGRLFDLALDFAEETPVLPLASARRVKEIAEEAGAIAKISSIHVNVWLGNYDKLSMTQRFLTARFGWNEAADLDRVIFVGDSPNDEPMFSYFPYACAVANIRRYDGFLTHFPAYMASLEGGAGFAEICAELLERRR